MNRRAFLTGVATSAVAVVAPVVKPGYLQGMVATYSPCEVLTQSPDHIDAMRHAVAAAFNIPVRMLSGPGGDASMAELLDFRYYVYRATEGLNIGTGAFGAEWSAPHKDKQLGSQERMT